MSPTIEVLYADDHVVVANKPSGMLVHRGWAQDKRTAMDEVRDAVGQRVHPLHRLDRGTSGALLFALDADVARDLAGAFERGEVGKRYVALVRGHLRRTGRLEHPVPSRERGPRVPAATSLRPIASSPHARCSLVEAQPHTGRLHQIRRHLKHLSHPIVGDVRYGDGRVNRHFREHHGLTRLALHAFALAFRHPQRGWLTVYAPLPPDLRMAWQALGVAPTDLESRANQPWTDDTPIATPDPPTPRCPP
ncbi:MAG: pseudouridylate synthase [Myxococcales bacterium FL481]|nr:MAG: pseudouridylate synthase [Myxococcales bacterium FL481]